MVLFQYTIVLSPNYVKAFCSGHVRMKKVDRQNSELKVDGELKGGMSLWDRITNDPQFIKAKHKIQTRYGLPLDYDIRLNHGEWVGWLGYDEKRTSKTAKRGQAFLKDVHALFKKFEVPDTWQNDLIGDIAGTSLNEVWSIPKFETYKDEKGNWNWRCIITPETDLTNPKYLEMIQSQQKQHAGNPPRPTRDKTNRRKLDWQPVFEWHKRHPLFTLEEIAKKIGYPAQKVRLKLAEFESRK